MAKVAENRNSRCPPEGDDAMLACMGVPNRISGSHDSAFCIKKSPSGTGNRCQATWGRSQAATGSNRKATISGKTPSSRIQCSPGSRFTIP